MTMRKPNRNPDGFTLIEMMIVIAIVAILASIAIPNFIAYRNKGYCAAAESDANNVSDLLANYFSEPERNKMPVVEAGTTVYLGFNLSSRGGANRVTVSAADNSPNRTITITVYDASNRCPRTSGGWQQNDHTYTLEMTSPIQ